MYVFCHIDHLPKSALPDTPLLHSSIIYPFPPYSGHSPQSEMETLVQPAAWDGAEESPAEELLKPRTQSLISQDPRRTADAGEGAAQQGAKDPLLEEEGLSLL